MKVTAVIGAGFGDEGKGHVVDYLAAEDPLQTIVVRYNGGPQARHTVVAGEYRHVFSHHGSGTIAGATTYLGPRFLVNPILWLAEFRVLEAMRLPMTTALFASPLCRVTTPYDMLINQEVERQRDAKRHGSCGVGIWETIERSNSGLYDLTMADLAEISDREIMMHLSAIRIGWVPERLKALRIMPSEEFNRQVYKESARHDQQFVDAVRIMQRRTELTTHSSCRRYKHVIFEGAQGLLLDRGLMKFYPYLTPSCTGLTHVAAMLENGTFWGSTLDVIYVTRSYMTRHGPGPFATEDPTMSFEDETNCHNEWQGSLRFGKLDVAEMRSAIKSDLATVEKLPHLRHASLAVNCLDQHEIDLEQLSDDLQIQIGLISRGRDRSDIDDYP